MQTITNCRRSWAVREQWSKSITCHVELTLEIDEHVGLNETESKALRDCLMEKGPQEFLDEVLNRRKMDPRHVGIAFHLDPGLDMDEIHYLKLLGLAISRVFWKRKKISKL